MTADPIRTLVFKLTAVVLALLLVLSVIASWSAVSRFEPILFPELRLKAEAVADVLGRQIDRALRYDLPLDQLPDLNQAIEAEAARHPDLAYATIEDKAGRVIAGYGQRPAADDNAIVSSLQHDGEVVAFLRLGLDPAYLQKASMDLILEIASVILVAVLLAFEVLLLVVHLSMARVIAWRHAFRLGLVEDHRVRREGKVAQHPTMASFSRRMLGYLRRQIVAMSFASGKRCASGAQPKGDGVPRLPFNFVLVRLPVFLFCLSEELSRPFMPAYAQSLAPTAPWLSPDWAVSLPIALFMLVWAFSQPVGARLSGRFGHWQAFAAATALAAIGLAMTAFAGNLLLLLLWRCVTALGYGIALIAVQGLIVGHTTDENRSSGLAHFVGALLAAGVCGPVAGGIIADQAGAEATLLVGALIALLSASVFFLLAGNEVSPTSHEGNSGIQSEPISALRSLVRDSRFIGIMALSAVPAKIAATGILFCLAPLLLGQEGASKAEIGRVQMMYFLGFILVSPLAASLSDRWQMRCSFVVAGGLGTMIALMPLALVSGAWAAPLAVALFGIAQSLIAAPQLTLATRVGRKLGVSEVATIGWYRFMERLGGGIGPLLAIALAATWSYREAVLGIGLITGTGAVLFWLMLLRVGQSSEGYAEKHAI